MTYVQDCPFINVIYVKISEMKKTKQNKTKQYQKNKKQSKTSMLNRREGVTRKSCIFSLSFHYICSNICFWYPLVHSKDILYHVMIYISKMT